jgi:hypothetical protein
MTAPFDPTTIPDGVYDPQTNVGAPMIDPGITAIQNAVQQSLPPKHEDAAPSQANAQIEPTVPDQLATIAQDEQLKLLAAALYLVGAWTVGGASRCSREALALGGTQSADALRATVGVVARIRPVARADESGGLDARRVQHDRQGARPALAD